MRGPYYKSMWAAMRDMGIFTINQIHHRVQRATKKAVHQYVCALEKGGYVRHIGFVEDSKIFEIVIPLPFAPKLNAKGILLTKADIRQRNAWRAMKALRRFTVLDLAVHASIPVAPITESWAEVYVRHLVRAGYLKRSDHGEKEIYAFLPSRNTGPLPPVVFKSKCVFDQNTRQVVWQRPGVAA